jgi:hypothetical protein
VLQVVRQIELVRHVWVRLRSLQGFGWYVEGLPQGVVQLQGDPPFTTPRADLGVPR